MGLVSPVTDFAKWMMIGIGSDEAKLLHEYLMASVEEFSFYTIDEGTCAGGSPATHQVSV